MTKMKRLFDLAVMPASKWVGVLAVSAAVLLMLEQNSVLLSHAHAADSEPGFHESDELIPVDELENTVGPAVSVQCVDMETRPYGPQVTDHQTLWWELHFSKQVRSFNLDLNNTLVEMAAQDDTVFAAFIIGGGADTIGGDGYDRVMRHGTTPKVSLLVGGAVSDVSGVVVTVPAGEWQDEQGNTNTASDTGLYLAHNWNVSVADASATEGTNDVTLIYFDVSLNARDDCKTVTVDWTTVDGTATAGDDYIADSGTLTFGPGETIKTVEVIILDDDEEDSGETFTLQLNNASGAALADAEATGTIFNEELPFVSVPQVAGVPQVGNTLEALFAEMVPADLAYSWLRGLEVIAGATASTYAPMAADVGARLSVRVESGGDSMTSAATGPVWPAPVNPPLADGEKELLSTTVTLGWHKYRHWAAGYGRALGASFGEIDDTSFEDGGTTHAVNLFAVNAIGQFGLATGATLPKAAGLVAYWNGYRISGLEPETADGGTLPLLVGRTPQPSEEYRRYADGSSDGVRVAVSLRRSSVEAQEALTAEFLNVPASHGDNSFSLELKFSQEPASSFSYRTLQGYGGTPSAISVTNGEVHRARRKVQGKNQHWEIEIIPAGTGDVAITLPATTDCSATGAICNSVGEPLSPAVSVMVPTNAPVVTVTPPTPFTVQFKSVPTEHDGSSAVVFEVHFSKNPHDYSYATLRTQTLEVQQWATTVTPRSASRLEQGSNKGWRVTINPVSNADMTIRIPATTDCSAEGAVCTGTTPPEMLSSGASATVSGPPGLSVADATVREGANVTVDFEVMLSRAASETVTVDYETSDGTATAGSDYTSTSGTLSFGDGETSKTVSVAVLDDAIDEDDETFTLTLSNASGGNAWLKDATATGTIENTDPMPQAWLARFGRTIASQAVDAIGGRMEGGGGSHVTVGGQSLSLSGEPMTPADEEDVVSALEALSLTDEPANESRGMTGRELLLGSSFRLAAGGEGGGSAFTAWGQFTTGGFEANVDGTRMDGSVTTGFLGADIGAADWLAGLALSVSEGDGDYTLTDGDDSGTVESSLTAVYPYARLSLSETVDVWGLVGHGTGDLTLVQNPNTNRAKTYKTDIGMRMVAIGARGEVVSPEEPDGLTVALKSDAFWVRTTSEAVRRSDGNLGASEADVNRVRLLVEGSRSFATGGGTLTPTLELGVRNDGGDAETGTGIEAGAGLRYTGGGVTVEGSVRTLLAHDETGYEEWGASGAVRIDPGPSGEGLSLSVVPTWGAASSGADRLWSLADTQGLSPEGEFQAGRRLETEVGYGLGGPDGLGMVTPYGGLTLSGAGERTWRLGARWQVAPSISLNLEGTRGEPANDDGPAHGLMLRGVLRL